MSMRKRPGKQAAAMVLFAVATRVGAVLDGRQRRGRAGTLLVALASAAAVVLAIAISPLIVVAEPQAKPAAQPEFEVASVKPNNSGNPSTRVRLVPDVNVENATFESACLAGI
jgi:hypothetical protein